MSVDNDLPQVSTLEAQAEEERARSGGLRESLDSSKREASSTREALAETRAGLDVTKEALQQAQVRRSLAFLCAMCSISGIFCLVL